MENPKPLKCPCADCVLKNWTPTSQLDRYRRKVLQVTNAERSKVGAPWLRLNPKLNRVAAQHNYGMAFYRKKLMYEQSKGDVLGNHVREAEYNHAHCAENTTRGHVDHHQLIRSLMKSPEQKKNILSPFAVDIGIHVGLGMDGQLYWTQVFGVTQEDNRRLKTGAGKSGK